MKSPRLLPWNRTLCPKRTAALAFVSHERIWIAANPVQVSVLAILAHGTDIVELGVPNEAIARNGNGITCDIDGPSRRECRWGEDEACLFKILSNRDDGEIGLCGGRP
jgi:hypothetical protein